MQSRKILNAFKCVILVFFTVSAHALVTPPNNPATGTNAAGGNALVEFDWQDSWGGIHMNSYADGLKDPGAPVNSSGQIPCQFGGFCKDMSRGGDDGLGAARMPGYSGQLANGIKYDIKNSILTCMSKLLPNWAYNHAPGYGRNSVCGVNGVPQMGPAAFSSDMNPALRWMSYAPSWDRRANDERTETSGGPGCQQQISNYCGNSQLGKDIRDIHACVKNKNGQPAEDGYLHPVSHVFSPEEVDDFGGRGATMPSKYYYFDKIISKGRFVTGATSLPEDGVYEDERSYQSTCQVEEKQFGNPQFADLESITCQSNHNPNVLLSSCDGPANPASSTRCRCKTQDVTLLQVTQACTKYDYQEIAHHRLGFSTDLKEKVRKAPILATVDTKDANLARIKSRLFTNVEPVSGDGSKFIIMDPSEFFDLKLYVAGGKYDSGYSQFSAPGVPATFDSCPVLGLTNGYGGICDPVPESPSHSNGGCNLAVYGVGPETIFNDAKGRSFNYNNYPVKWSGYVKKWAVISPAQYWKNVSSRKKQNQNFYLNPNLGEVNKNPILMLTRSNDYCDATERTSNPDKVNTTGLPLPMDMDCIQYLQLQETSGLSSLGSGYLFMNLYSPNEIQSVATTMGFGMMYTHDRDPNTGLPISDRPIPGSGSGRYLAGTLTTAGNKFASFKDSSNAATVYRMKNSRNAIVNVPAVRNLDYKGRYAVHPVTGKQISGLTYSTQKAADGSYLPMPGDYLGGLDPTRGATRGVGILLEPGTVSSIKTSSQMRMGANNGNCAIINYKPNAPAIDPKLKVFVPTNSDEEIQAFVDAGIKNEIDVSVQVRPCEASFEANVDVAKRSAASQVAGTSTWTGMIDCDSLVTRPACNQAKMIVGQRFCQLENGSIDSCSLCKNSEDADGKLSFTNELVHGEVMANPSINSNNRCFFSAACFNNNADGCPAAGTAGGHVFCLAPETKITMADGTEKEIKKIKAGDKVMSFDTKFSKDGHLSQKKVKATAVTQNQEIIKIDDLRITPLHKIVLATGRAVMAKEVKIGDKILKSDGLITTVQSVEAEEKPITVYNLILENDNYGYIANGLRVLSYPDVKGLEN